MAQESPYQRAHRGCCTAVMIYEASVRGEMSDVLGAAFTECLIAAGHGTTIVRFRPEALREVLDRFQDFGLDLIDLRLCEVPSGVPPPD
jgi:hypothetical protein